MIGQSMSNANGSGIPELSIKVGLSPRRDLMTIVSDHDHEEFINVFEVKASLHLDARGETAGKFSAIFDGYHNKYPVNDPAFRGSRLRFGKLITGDE